MTFVDLVAGDAVFLDANPFIYHLSPHPVLGTACSHLMQRIENRDLQGFTATHVLGEVAHQLLIAEAVAAGGWVLGKVKLRLKQQPAVLQQLTRFRTSVETVLQSQVQVLTIPPGLISMALALSQQHGLLVNDALIVAVMTAHGLTKIASHDADFDRVPGLTRYAPA
jgi:predicted nucleic acid-binding protein